LPSTIEGVESVLPSLITKISEAGENSDKALRVVSIAKAIFPSSLSAGIIIVKNGALIAVSLPRVISYNTSLFYEL
jgi:hypothetical protein